MTSEKPKRGPCKDKVHRDKVTTCRGIGREFRCPECGSIFLVTTGEWGYVYKGRKYCRHRCVCEAERRDEK